MSPKPVIKSILIRYEKDLPVSIEEKAVLHKWLREAIKFCYGLKPSVWPSAKSAFFSKEQNANGVNLPGTYAHRVIQETNLTDKLLSHPEKGQHNNSRINSTHKGIYRIRNFTSAFFRIFASCLPTKK